MTVGEYFEAKNKIPNFRDLWQGYRTRHFLKVFHDVITSLWME